MTEIITTDVVVVGAGPAGALLANLLARLGIGVTLVERALDPERTFRGETIAARSVSILRELGHSDALEEAGFLDLEGISFHEKGRRILEADYGCFPIGVLPIDMPQPALLKVLLDSSSQYPNFTFLNGTSFVSLLIEADCIVRGVEAKTRGGNPLQIQARLVVGADGRFSKLRKASGLTARITPMNRDFVWFKLPRPNYWPHQSQLVVKDNRHLVILPTYPDMLRVGYNLPKNGFAAARREGIDFFRSSVAELDPRLADLVAKHIGDWSDVSYLEIYTAEMEHWARDGLLLIGDAAHTVTPILGQGVNLAIQDAVAFAPVIEEALATFTGALAADVFAPTIAARRAHKAMITRFQRRQEDNLAKSTRLGTALRRLRLKALHRSPLKYKMLNRLMNAPFDLQASVSYRSMLARLSTPLPVSTEEVRYDSAA